jgi:hypothetical protein
MTQVRAFTSSFAPLLKGGVLSFAPPAKGGVGGVSGEPASLLVSLPASPPLSNVGTMGFVEVPHPSSASSPPPPPNPPLAGGAKEGPRHAKALLALFLSACLLSGCGPSPITRTNFDRIQPGMTQAEVEAILGAPHSKYQGTLSWKTNHERTIITVVLDDEGRVDTKSADGL